MKGFGNTRIEVSGVMMEMKAEKYENHIKNGTMLFKLKIDRNGGAIAFVDDFTTWVSQPTAQSNQRGIQAVIDKALDRERWNGATFEVEKTTIIHFTRYTGRTGSEPFTTKDERGSPKDQVNILGVIVNSRIHYEQHIVRGKRPR
ncbi:hypothetical protein FOTG_17336 [Fusarium oxysporum f. sp. vasinfectum 25433]|uniref:Uncharacterized protein n=1 Tax=Fusarium oxysporum f. sp. vasinfectum 25433 TaxID=1089449 RepID=X0KKW5_FUSOX|nr:hypothetical protein FOTG_17336 [Fusarium oxysporum f. sp. vasinfectum 25433]